MGDDVSHDDSADALVSAWASFRDAQHKRAQLHSAAQKIRSLYAPEDRGNGFAHTARAR